VAHADLYAVLGVQPSANRAELDHAFRALVRRYHPDTCQAAASHDAESSSDPRLQQILHAYGVLRDPAKRAAYDRHHHPIPEPLAPPAQPPEQTAARPSIHSHHSGRQPQLRVGQVRWHRIYLMRAPGNE
jgi:DnaJ-class molecular chaperone